MTMKTAQRKIAFALPPIKHKGNWQCGGGSNHRDRSILLERLGGSPGLVVMGRDSCSKGRGFESRHRILDGLFSHIFVVKIVMMFA